MKTRGLVVELERNEAVIMAETGEFIICTPRPGMAIGDVVEVSIWEQKQVWRGLQIGLSGAAVFILGSLLGLGLFFSGSNQVYAYMDVDHDSSLALALNRDLKITEARPLNAQARRLLQEAQFTGKPIREALALLVRESGVSRKGSTAPDAVLVAVAIKQTDKAAGQGETQQLLSRIGGSIPRRIQRTDSSAVEVKTVTVASRDGKAARQMKLSMGRYYYYQKAKQRGARFTVKEVRTLSEIRLIKDLEQLETGRLPGCHCGSVCEKSGVQLERTVKGEPGGAVTSDQRGSVNVVSRRNPETSQTRVESKPEHHAGSQRNSSALGVEAVSNHTENSVPKPKGKFRWFTGPGYVPGNQSNQNVGTGDGGNAASTNGQGAGSGSSSSSSIGSGSQTTGSGRQSCNGNRGSGNRGENSSGNGSGRRNGR